MPIGSLLFSRRLRMRYILDGKLVMWREKVNTSNWHRAVPLLEQDQLQEMVGEFNLLKFWQQFFSISDYIIESEVGFELPEWAIHRNSWEQLWLSFVMKSLYSKVWDGNNWIKEE